MRQTAPNDWDASAFFARLVDTNKLARREHFDFCRVSGLEGFEEALDNMQQSVAMCCVSDVSDGYTELNNTPRTRRVKTVFLAMRHAVNDMDARLECMDCMRELFRQFMSALLRERTKIQEGFLYIDPRISFTEIDRYFFAGGACAYFQVAVDLFADLCYDDADWE